MIRQVPATTTMSQFMVSLVVLLPMADEGKNKNIDVPNNQAHEIIANVSDQAPSEYLVGGSLELNINLKNIGNAYDIWNPTTHKPIIAKNAVAPASGSSGSNINKASIMNTNINALSGALKLGSMAAM